MTGDLAQAEGTLTLISVRLKDSRPSLTRIERIVQIQFPSLSVSRDSTGLEHSVETTETNLLLGNGLKNSFW